jgi:hypothetical protein
MLSGLERSVDSMLGAYAGPALDVRPQVVYEVVSTVRKAFDELLRAQGIIPDKNEDPACCREATSWRTRPPSAATAELRWEGERDIRAQTCEFWHRRIVTDNPILTHWTFQQVTYTDGAGSLINMLSCGPAGDKTAFIITEQKIHHPPVDPDDNRAYAYCVSVSVAFRCSRALYALLRAHSEATYYSWARPWEMFRTLVDTTELKNCHRQGDSRVFAHQDFIPIIGQMAITPLHHDELDRIIGFIAPHAQRQQGVSPAWFPTPMQGTIRNTAFRKFFWALDAFKLLFIIRTDEEYIVGVVCRTRAQAAEQTWS